MASSLNISCNIFFYTSLSKTKSRKTHIQYPFCWLSDFASTLQKFSSSNLKPNRNADSYLYEFALKKL